MQYSDAPNRSHQRSGIVSKIQNLWDFICVAIIALFSSLRTESILLNHRTLVVEKQLGEGGYSFVYLVRDKATGGKFALKKIQAEYPDHVTMLKTEIQTYNKVNHRNILKLIDSKVEQGAITFGYLLLPLYKNGTIQDLIDKSERGLPLRSICVFGIDICNGLNAFQYIFTYLAPAILP
jgi:serine/threonine protein kinase